MLLVYGNLEKKVGVYREVSEHDSTSSENENNLLQILRLVAKTDPVLRKRVEDFFKHRIHYHSVQNRIMHISAQTNLVSSKTEVEKARILHLLLMNQRTISTVIHRNSSLFNWFHIRQNFKISSGRNMCITHEFSPL